MDVEGTLVWYLLLVDWTMTARVWALLGLVVLVSSGMIWTPRVRSSWRRTTLRVFGSILMFAVIPITILFALLAMNERPREHIAFASRQGGRVALLSHSELRDSSATRLTVKGSGLRAYLAYEYYGDGSDYMGKDAVVWIDDHHLKISYARDPSGVQQCYSQVGDVTVVCASRPPPVFGSDPIKNK